MRHGGQSAHGSPPPAWGRPAPRSRPPVRARFTPTRVGTAPSPHRPGRACPVHPHPRGDGGIVVSFPTGEFGSPPPAWGRRAPSSVVSRLQRFTPTRVGTAAWRHHDAQTSAVHPHPRGDGAVFFARVEGAVGSPPPAWGRRRTIRNVAALHRFTPTRVGTAEVGTIVRSYVSVHPHPRGDGHEFACNEAELAGSPPPAWGRRRTIRNVAALHRFTPTRVGTAAASMTRSEVGPVHPHPRGDGEGGTEGDHLTLGSPPPAWGRRAHAKRVALHRRFTPTRVGTARRRGKA